MPTLTPKLTPKPRRTQQAYRDEYLVLNANFPLAPIATKAALRRAEKIMDNLAVLDERAMSRAQSDYLAVLTDLYEAAERKLFAEELAELTGNVKEIDGRAALQFLVEQHAMSAADLGRLLGNRSLGSAILRGDREMSKANIVILARHFSVKADLFL